MSEEVAVVNVNNTNQPNADWKGNPERLSNAKYIITEKNRKVKTVYENEGVTQHKNGRTSFNQLKKAPQEVQEKYKNLDVSRKRGESNPVRYFEALD